MQITWYGHACFEIEHEGYSVVLDPYKPGKVPGLKPLVMRAHQVLCSHNHDDHNYVAAVEVIANSMINPFTIESLETWHDEVKGAKRGKTLIHILSAAGLRVAHLGDLGCPLTEVQMRQLGALDAVMIPIGGVYTLNAVQAKTELDKLKVSLILPMHYRSEGFGFAELGELSLFTDLYDQAMVNRYTASNIAISKRSGTEIAILHNK
jgi:L-ascorbate metabolism protein UlaG (beta-lactamase superfamily)